MLRSAPVRRDFPSQPGWPSTFPRRAPGTRPGRGPIRPGRSPSTRPDPRGPVWKPPSPKRRAFPGPRRTPFGRPIVNVPPSSPFPATLPRRFKSPWINPWKVIPRGEPLYQKLQAAKQSLSWTGGSYMEHCAFVPAPPEYSAAPDSGFGWGWGGWHVCGLGGQSLGSGPPWPFPARNDHPYYDAFVYIITGPNLYGRHFVNQSLTLPRGQAISPAFGYTPVIWTAPWAPTPYKFLPGLVPDPGHSLVPAHGYGPMAHSVPRLAPYQVPAMRVTVGTRVAVQAAAHDKLPPMPGDAEAKGRTRLSHLLMAGLSAATDSADVTKAFYNSLPWKMRRFKGRNGKWMDRHVKPQDQLMFLLANAGKINLDKAAVNLVWNEAVDRVYGKLGKGLARYSKAYFKNQRGWQAGGWDTPPLP